jgi:hypothetical protein
LGAGILFADGVIWVNLQVNRSLLLAVLAEIKTLLANYAAANGKYEEFLPQGDVDWDDQKEPETELIYLLCSPPADKDDHSGAKTSGLGGGGQKNPLKV